MRRLLVLIAASGLALLGLNGTATAADSTPRQTDPTVVLNEVGIDFVDPVFFQPGINYGELHNLDETSVDIDGWSINSCAANGALLGTTVFGFGSTIPGGAFRIAANNNYSSSNLQLIGPRDFAWNDSLDAGGGIALIDDTGTAVHSVVFDSTPSVALLNCVQSGDFIPEVSPSPTTTEVAERCFDASDNPFWQLTDQPTPRNTNDCSTA